MWEGRVGVDGEGGKSVGEGVEEERVKGVVQEGTRNSVALKRLQRVKH